MSLKYIFAQPEYVVCDDKKNPLPIHPIKLKDYNKFQECSSLLYLSKSHFQDIDYPLLALVFMAKEQLRLTFEEMVEKFTDLFSLITRKEVQFISVDGVEGFLVGNVNLISVQNYEPIRAIIMKQNLMFEQKVYKDPIVQEWANKVLMARQKNSTNISIEDFITTVKNYDGLTYEQIQEQTIYQLYADFYRVGKIMEFQQSSLFATVSSEKITIRHFAENIDIFKSPYDDLFVSSKKLGGLNSAMQQG